MDKKELSQLFQIFESEIQTYDLNNRRPYNTSDFQKSKLKKLHLHMPSLRQFLPSFWEKLDLQNKLTFLDYNFLHSQISESLTWSLIQASKFKNGFLLEHQSLFTAWVQKVENWWHSDGLSSLYARILEEDLKTKNCQKSQIFQILQKWNNSKNPWEKRQSVVSLFYYASLRRSQKLPYQEVIKLIKNLLSDSDYYVQKAVGWALRETYQVYPEEVKKFLRANIKQIKPAAWQASSEKLEKSFKNSLKAMRK